MISEGSDAQTAQQIHWAVRFWIHKWVRHFPNRKRRLLKAAQGFRFIFVNVENRQQLGNNQEVLDFVGEIEQL